MAYCSINHADRPRSRPAAPRAACLLGGPAGLQPGQQSGVMCSRFAFPPLCCGLLTQCSGPCWWGFCCRPKWSTTQCLYVIVLRPILRGLFGLGFVFLCSPLYFYALGVEKCGRTRSDGLAGWACVCCWVHRVQRGFFRRDPGTQRTPPDFFSRWHPDKFGSPPFFFPCFSQCWHRCSGPPQALDSV